MAYEMMKDLYQAQEEMKELVEKGELKEAARNAMNILNAFGMAHVVNVEAFKVCFDSMSKEEFYNYVIEFADTYLNKFKK